MVGKEGERTYGGDCDLAVCVCEVVDRTMTVEDEKERDVLELRFPSRYALEIFQDDDIPRTHRDQITTVFGHMN